MTKQVQIPPSDDEPRDKRKAQKLDRPPPREKPGFFRGARVQRRS